MTKNKGGWAIKSRRLGWKIKRIRKYRDEKKRKRTNFKIKTRNNSNIMNIFFDYSLQTEVFPDRSSEEC